MHWEGWHDSNWIYSDRTPVRTAFGLFEYTQHHRRVRHNNRALLNSRRKAAMLSNEAFEPGKEIPQIWFDSDEPDDFAKKLHRNRTSFLRRMEEEVY